MAEATDLERAYVADVVHDLQNPLTGMRAQLEVAMAYSDTPVARDWVRSMLAATTEMELLVSDLLALAAEERRDQPAPRDTVDLEALVRSEAGRFRPGRPVQVTVDQVGPVEIRGDETSLRRMLRNLLDNAVRHATDQVWVNVRHDDAQVVLDVIDDGPGVPQEHRERIFERFYRADPQNRQGTGLGLSIVRQAAERHGGSVSMLPSGPGEGAHFQVVLPVPD